MQEGAKLWGAVMWRDTTRLVLGNGLDDFGRGEQAHWRAIIGVSSKN